MIKPMLLLSLQNDKSSLMLASENGHTEIVKHLVEAKASLDLQSHGKLAIKSLFLYCVVQS